LRVSIAENHSREKANKRGDKERVREENVEDEEDGCRGQVPPGLIEQPREDQRVQENADEECDFENGPEKCASSQAFEFSESFF
jgi:hypothetical protein